MSKIKTYFMELGDVYVRTDTGELCGPYEGIEEAILDIEFGWDEIVAAVKAAATLTEPGQVAFDGSMYSPSDRTIPGVEAIWEAYEEGPWSRYDIWQEADDRLTKLYDELGLYWEEGVLFKADPEERDDDTPPAEEVEHVISALEELGRGGTVLDGGPASERAMWWAVDVVRRAGSEPSEADRPVCTCLTQHPDDPTPCPDCDGLETAFGEIQWVIDDLRSWESNSESANYNASQLADAMATIKARLS